MRPRRRDAVSARDCQIGVTAAVLLGCSISFARPAVRPTTYDQMIGAQARAHGVPEAFVHRIVMRESRYNPRVVHKHCYGLMQIKYATARSMGYKGSAHGLLDPETNLTYAVPYLANAYRLADGNEHRATALFSSGYYSLVKRKNILGQLRTASSTPAPEIEAPEPPGSPLAGLFSYLAGSPERATPP
jgi:soluble lytic murein transglycosylase-like protein